MTIKNENNKHLAHVTTAETVAALTAYCAEPHVGGDDDVTHVPLVVRTKLVLQTVQMAEEQIKQLESVPANNIKFQHARMGRMKTQTRCAAHSRGGCGGS